MMGPAIAPANPAHQENTPICQVRQLGKHALAGLRLGGRRFDARFKQNLPSPPADRKGAAETFLNRLSGQTRTMRGQKNRRVEATLRRFKSQGFDA